MTCYGTNGCPAASPCPRASASTFSAPLITYLPDGDRYIVTAGNAGSDGHPAWYYNLVATPEVTVELGIEVFRAVAVIAGEPERGTLYELFADAYPQAADYQARTTRQIPVVILTPSSIIPLQNGPSPAPPSSMPSAGPITSRARSRPQDCISGSDR